jgi:hypothetical protein
VAIPAALPSTLPFHLFLKRQERLHRRNNSKRESHSIVEEMKKTAEMLLDAGRNDVDVGDDANDDKKCKNKASADDDDGDSEGDDGTDKNNDDDVVVDDDDDGDEGAVNHDDSVADVLAEPWECRMVLFDDLLVIVNEATSKVIVKTEYSNICIGDMPASFSSSSSSSSSPSTKGTPITLTLSSPEWILLITFATVQQRSGLYSSLKSLISDSDSSSKKTTTNNHTIEYSDGCMYEGEVERTTIRLRLEPSEDVPVIVRSGKGKLTFTDKSVYEGWFDKNFRSHSNGSHSFFIFDSASEYFFYDG